MSFISQKAGEADCNQYRNEKIRELDDLESQTIAIKQKPDELNVTAGWTGKVVRLGKRLAGG